ncbi:MAG: hypothetical protein SAK29_10540 [Scytonema sp. PMC 1069.18]|nr:hypothetical protein [Scytonema sp. PMC 1069.18]
MIVHKQQTKTCRLTELSLVVVLPGVQFTDVAIAQLLERGLETIFLFPQNGFLLEEIAVHLLTQSMRYSVGVTEFCCHGSTEMQTLLPSSFWTILNHVKKCKDD